MSNLDTRTVDEQVRAIIDQYAEIGKPLPADPAEWSTFEQVLYRMAEYLWHHQATGELPGPTGAYGELELGAALNIVGDAYVEVTRGNQ